MDMVNRVSFHNFFILYYRRVSLRFVDLSSRKFVSMLGKGKQLLKLTIFDKNLKSSTPPSRSQISGATKNCIFCHFWGFWSKTPKNTKIPIFVKNTKK